MTNLKPPRVEEIRTLKTFLRNRNQIYNESLIDTKRQEPTDIRYENINYQMTSGDKEQLEEMRREESKGGISVKIRDTSDIASLLLYGALTKKSARSDPNTILLIEVSSTGPFSWDDLKRKFDDFALKYLGLRGNWKEIYAVFPQKNIQIYN